VQRTERITLVNKSILVLRKERFSYRRTITCFVSNAFRAPVFCRHTYLFRSFVFSPFLLYIILSFSLVYISVIFHLIFLISRIFLVFPLLYLLLYLIFVILFFCSLFSLVSHHSFNILSFSDSFSSSITSFFLHDISLYSLSYFLSLDADCDISAFISSNQNCE
jgi:hypothetical protein